MNKCTNCLEDCEHRYCLICTDKCSKMFFARVPTDQAYRFLNNMDDEKFKERRQVLDSFFAGLND